MPGLPHVRGGVSSLRTISRVLMMSSPRAWGCFWTGQFRYTPVPVFPTCVGVFRGVIPVRHNAVRLPHVRGGVSICFSTTKNSCMSSPRAWGCFRNRPPPGGQATVFPTCVGVFLLSPRKIPYLFCLPHVRGGVSSTSGEDAVQDVSSPRAWGCF